MPPDTAERRPRREGGAQDAANVNASVQADLDTARELAAAGIPVFVAYPDPDKPGKYKMPGGWQKTTANPAYVGAWRPGRALCAVMGHGLDLVDIDPQNGGDPASLAGLLPDVRGVAASPSGGEHRFVPSMGVRSRDGVLPGIDVKAGDPSGQGRGFAFIAPTVGVSKTTGERVAYRWVKPPDLTGLNGGGSVAPLADTVRRAHGGHKQASNSTSPFQQPASTGWGRHTGSVQPGGRHQALVSYAGWLRKQGIPLRPEAETLMLRRLQDCEPDAGGPRYTGAYALEQLRDVYSRYPAGDPMAESASGSMRAWDGDPAGLLDEVARFLRSYVAFPSSHAGIAVTLWAAHTHLAAGFESTPRLALLSPEKQCGKSRVLELLALLSAGAETLSDASPAYLYRRIGAGTVTVLLDEADAIWKRGKSDETAEALRSVINAGHRKSATVGRVEMQGQAAKLVRFPVYAPAALAGIGTLPDTILDRAVIVRMRRRAPDEPVRDYRERVTRPEGHALREKLAGWATTAAESVGDPWPDLPPGVADRNADVWEPLVMIADLAGGDWPKLAREACTAFVDRTRDDTETAGTRLLADLRDIFGDSDVLSTETILTALCALDEAPWSDWYGKPLNPRGLAKLLKPYQVGPAQVRIGTDTPRGYRRTDLQAAWRSYLAAGSETSTTSKTSLASHVLDVSDVVDTGAGCAVCGDPLDLALAAAGYATHPMCDPDERAAP